MTPYTLSVFHFALLSADAAPPKALPLFTNAPAPFKISSHDRLLSLAKFVIAAASPVFSSSVQFLNTLAGRLKLNCTNTNLSDFVFAQ